LYPVVNGGSVLMGVVTRGDLAAWRAADGPPTVAGLMREPIVAYPDETLRSAVERMSVRRLGVLPVVERGREARLVGLVTQLDLLRARERLATEERGRARALRFRPVPLGRRAARPR
jgi:CIC family chloride channel protein